MKARLCLSVMLAVLCAFYGVAQAGQAEKDKLRRHKFERFEFQTVEIPRSDGVTRFTTLGGINDKGQITGGFTTSDAEAFVINRKGKISRIACPDARFTHLAGINNSGAMSGTCFPAGGDALAFLRTRSGEFIFFDIPEATKGSFGQGLNDRNQVVGYYRGESGFQAFVWDDEIVTPFELPDLQGVLVFPSGINDQGQIVGAFTDAPCNCNSRGFLLSNGLLTIIEFPGAQATIAAGINDKGHVVGTYIDGDEKHHGFVYDQGKFFPVDVPVPGIEFTEASGINNRGIIVGRYVREDPNSEEDPIHDFGFIATPKR